MKRHLHFSFEMKGKMRLIALVLFLCGKRLVPDIQSLQEILVIGYGTQKRKDVTGAI
jgi:hypothetical protein